jgi:hypothetical protein
LAHVRYCYRCGRRASPDQPDCWYCGTTVRRTLRAERRCPYCDEVVREKAIKCANCGEFLDQAVDVERERTGRKRTASDERIPVTRKPREDRTVQVSREPARPAIEQKTRLKLEAPTRFRSGANRDPEAAATAESPEIPESVLKGRAKPKDLIRVERKEREIATVEVEVEPAGAPALRDAASVPSTRAEVRDDGFLSRLRDLFFGSPPAPQPQLEVRATARFRNCAICGTEILVTDNYCFHCGQKYARQDFRFSPQTRAPLNFAAYAMAGVGLIPHLLYFLVPGKSPAWLLLVSAMGVVGILGYSATNSFDRRNRAVSWFLLLASMAVMAVPLVLEYGPE